MRNITIITGASSGLGAEFARQLSADYLRQNKTDWEIWLIARSYENLSNIKSEILNSSDCEDNRIKILSINLNGINGASRFKELIQKENSAGVLNIELLINNAGFGTYGPFNETPVEKEMEMIDLNCTALTGICGYALPYMTKGSSIINTASLASFMPLGNFTVYAASKAYVLSFSVALAAELKEKGINVSALCPGSVSTNFANVASNGARKEVLHGKDPVKVVAHCLRKARKGKKIILWASKWKITAFFSRFAGRFFVARITYLFNKRPYNQ